MFATLLQPIERTTLVAPCRYFLAGVPPATQQVIAREVANAFDEWKRAQADSNGMAVVRVAAKGLLTLLGGTETSLKRIDDATAYEVAGPWVSNDIDLAFKLWLEECDSFKRVLQSHGLERVFAVIGQNCYETALMGSLIRLNGLLFDCITAYGEAKMQLARKGLERARGIAVQRRKEKAKEMDRLRWESAVEYLMRHPRHHVEDAADFLHKQNANYGAPSTIQRKIKGAKAEALSRLASRVPKR